MSDAASSLTSLIEQVSALQPSALDPRTAENAAAVVADVMAAAARGMREPELDTLAKRSRSDGSTGSAVLGHPDRWFAPERAAFLHGCAAVAHELDESIPGGGHPGAHVVPAALAVAQSRNLGGRELVTAVVAGYEVSAQLFHAWRPVYPSHPHGFFGALGSAVAVGMLEGVDPLECAAVVAATPLLPGWVPSLAGMNARNLQVGAAAEQAVAAAELTAAGFRGSIDAVAEILPKILGPGQASGVRTRSDGDEWQINSSVIRRHAVAGPLNVAIEAASSLGRFDRDDIVTVRLAVPERVVKFASAPLAARDLAARFSLPHAVLARLVNGAASVEDFGYDPAIAEMIERAEVVAHEAPEIRLEVTLADGTLVTAVEPVPMPSSPVPLVEQVLRKWTDLEDQSALQTARDCLELSTVSDCADLFARAAA